MAVGYVFKHHINLATVLIIGTKGTRPVYTHLKIKGINCLGLFNIEYEKDEERMLKEFGIKKSHNTLLQ